MRTQVMVVVLSCLLCACASIQERSVKVDEKIMMPVFYGTDRLQDDEKSLKKTYTRDRGDTGFGVAYIDAAIFKNDQAPRLVKAGLVVTLYTSTNDNAMAVSHAIHGHPRAGDSRKGPIIVAGIETIDVTDANNSIIGHSYFKESEMVANDLGQLLNDRLPAAKRTNLVTSKDPSGQYWSLNANPAMSK